MVVFITKPLIPSPITISPLTDSDLLIFISALILRRGLEVVAARTLLSTAEEEIGSTCLKGEKPIKPIKEIAITPAIPDPITSLGENENLSLSFRTISEESSKSLTTPEEIL